MSKMTIYTSRQVKSISELRELWGWSIRKIGKETKVPKSVVGRWIKDPQLWIEKYDLAEGQRKKASWSPKRKLAWEKFHEKILKREKKAEKIKDGTYKGMQVRYDEDDDFELYS